LTIQPGAALAQRFFSGTGATYDHMVNLTTVGFDIWWKRKILKKIPPLPARILDQASGTGILTFKIARRFPSVRVIGIELREEYLNIAREKNKVFGLNNVKFILGRAEDVLLKGRFDCITSSYLGKYAELEVLVKNAKGMLREGGVIIMHDFSYPENRLYSGLLWLHFKMLQTIGSRKYPEWKTIFYELPGLIRRTRWVTELVHSLEMNEFSLIEVDSHTMGISTIVSAKLHK
jgi:demethylmenaquinone methyltransferase/2-methoxy-6-polyprenyl-1,4-benzoquinol methylase